MNRAFRVTVRISGAITKILGARDEAQARRNAERSVAMIMPPEFGGNIVAGKPLLLKGVAEHRAKKLRVRRR